LYIRYGAIDLVSYEDVGGGTHKIKNKLHFATHCESGNPKCYSAIKLLKRDEIDNVKYERPHKKLSAQEHISLQSRTKIEVKIVSEHDVALLYVPDSLVDEKNITTLGMENPTLAVRLVLENNKDLFGFKFILIGQETLDLIKKYAPEKGIHDFKGFQKLFNVAGLALSPETLALLKKVDTALYKAIPDKLAQAKSRIELGEIAWDLFKEIAQKETVKLVKKQLYENYIF
jgi:hypothetical protein